MPSILVKSKVYSIVLKRDEKNNSLLFSNKREAIKMARTNGQVLKRGVPICERCEPHYFMSTVRTSWDYCVIPREDKSCLFIFIGFVQPREVDLHIHEITSVWIVVETSHANHVIDNSKIIVHVYSLFQG